jgi:hypothetical protein
MNAAFSSRAPVSPAIERPRFRDRDSALIASTALLTVPALIIVLLAQPKIGVLACLAVCIVLGLTFVVKDRPDGLAVLLVVTSAVQRGLSTLTADPNALLLDDLILALIAVYLITRIRSILSSNRPMTLGLLGVLLVLLFGLIRTPDLTIGLYQLRQCLVPILLLIFGFVTGVEQLAKLRPWVIGFGLVAAIYAIGEFFGVRPLDPLTFTSFQTIRILEHQREFPGSYYYWFSDNDYLLRSGSFLLNPPLAGIYMAAATLWVWWGRQRVTLAAAAITAVLVLGVGLTIARAGIVILGLLLLQPVVTAKLGRWSFVAVGTLLGLLAFNEIATHAAASRHSDGALYGLQLAFEHPLGAGFGLVGNILKSGVGDGEGESSLAIFFAGTGLLGVAAVGALLWRGIRQGRTVGGVALTAAVVVALFAETGSGLDGSGMLWILAGTALAGSSSVRSHTESLDGPKPRDPINDDYLRTGELRA